MKTWLPLIPELKFLLFCCLWNSLGCLDVSGQVFPILNLFVWKRAQIREHSLSQALLVLLWRLKFWLERTDFWAIEAQSPSPSLSAGTLWQIPIRSWGSSPVSSPCLGGSPVRVGAPQGCLGWDLPSGKARSVFMPLAPCEYLCVMLFLASSCFHLWKVRGFSSKWVVTEAELS